jgi:GNAT superfamily N-acetyltransferase
MKINLSSTDIRLAIPSEKPIIVKILTESFKYDPHINWLLEKTKNKNKLSILINYVVDETFNKGAIFLTRDNLGTALWHTEKKETVNFEFIFRNLHFLFHTGVSCVIRNLRSLNVSHKHFPANQPYCYLYMIGVLPEGQGKGLASKLMNPVIDYCNKAQIPVYLETANPINVEIYKKKGFTLIDSVKTASTRINYMRINAVI